MLRVTKISPGSASHTTDSGTRESAHPIHKILGVCVLASWAASSGLVEQKLELHALFFERRSDTCSILGDVLHELVEWKRVEPCVGVVVEGATLVRQAMCCVVERTCSI